MSHLTEFDRQRSALFPGDPPTYPLQVGPASAFADPAPDRIGWTGTPPDPGSVRAVHLEPSLAQLTKQKLPTWLSSLTQLESLTTPAALLGPLAAAGILDRLTSIRLTFSLESVQSLPRTTFGFPERRLERMRAVHWVCNTLNGLGCDALGLRPEDVPNLAFVGFEIGSTRAFRDLHHPKWHQSKLTFLEISEVGDADPLADAPPTVEFLSLHRLGPKVDLSGLVALPRLRGLRVVGSRAPIDIASLAALPALREVVFIGCKRLVNTEQLADLQHLQHIHLVDCGRPFDAATKARVQERGLPHFDVRFA